MFDKDIPIPNKTRYYFEAMEIGDSKLFADVAIKRIYSSLTYAKKKTGNKYTAKTVQENGVIGVRVWRIE